MHHLIYLTPSHTRFFHIPADHVLPPGDFVVRNLEKQELHVSEEALREFEIPKAQAEALLAEQMKQAFTKASDAIASSQDVPDAAPSTAKSEDLLRDALQWPKGEELKGEHLVNGLRSLLGLLSETLAVAASDDPATQAQAEQRMAGVRAKLEGYGFPVDKAIEDLPAKLSAWRETHTSAADQEQVARLQERLKALSEKSK